LEEARKIVGGTTQTSMHSKQSGARKKAGRLGEGNSVGREEEKKPDEEK